MKDFLIFISEIVKIVVIALFIVLPIRYFLFQPFFVKGQSMEPNFQDRDYLIIDEISYRFSEPQRGDVVIFKYPNDPYQRYIKRMIGLPEETVIIKDGEITIISSGIKEKLDETIYFPEDIYTEGEIEVTLMADEFFVLGDNRANSYDSRRWGILPRKNIIGKAFFRVFPINNFEKIDVPNYELN